MSAPSEAEDFKPKLPDLFKNVRAIVEGDGEADQRFRRDENELQGIKEVHFLDRMKLLEQTLLNLSALEGRLRMIIVKAEKTNSSVDTKEIFDASVLDLVELVERNVEQIKDAVVGVRSVLPKSQTEAVSAEPGQLGVAQKMSEELSRLRLEDRLHESPGFANMRRSYDNLESTELKMCCLSFSIFPDDSVMKKRPLIYWWIGEGFITSTQDKTAEEVGEEIFEKLVTVGFTQPHLDESSGIVTSCIMHPWIRRMLILLAQEAGLFHFDSRWPRLPSHDPSTCKRACLTFNNPTLKGTHEGDDLLTVFNVNSQYLSERDWLNKLKKVAVLQLGRWQHSAAYQIEVEGDKILRGLGVQKHLKYLSLRGISRITHLPSSILNLISLEILDLRSCHHLANLPSNISPLKKLTHLDVSECYFLASMPEGLDRLTSLQVLKGFVIRDSERTPCSIGDLTKLKNLRRLSIHIGNEAVVRKGEFTTLKEISSLRRLKISWGVVSEKLKAHIIEESLQFSFPLDLEKLDLQGIPLEHVPKWLSPSHLKRLKKLYIRGGELVSLDHGEPNMWSVQVLRLKYLRKLNIGSPSLEEMFPSLQHLEFENRHETEKDK